MHVKQRIGWVASEVILDDDFSAWENLWLQSKLQSLPDWKDRAGDLLEYFGLKDRRKDRVKTFSTGMRKKLEIALALLHQPEVVFMDEPTIGLDANTRRMLWDLITGVNKEFGITVLLTSHYIEEADALCDQISIIDHGKIVASGTPTALKARVQSDFVELETSEAVDEAQLRSIPGGSEVRSQGKAWILRVSAAEEVLPKIFSTLKTEAIRRINVEKPSLETVFLDITGKGSTRRAPTYRTTGSSTRPCGGRDNEHGDDPCEGHRPDRGVGATKREPTEPVRGAVRPRAPADIPESLGARDHVRATVHVARVLREQLQRCLPSPRPDDLPHEQLHRVPASRRPSDLDVDRGNVRIHEHDPGQALRIHEAHLADADDEIHRVPVEGPRIDEPRAHPDSRDDPGGRAVRRQLSRRPDHVGRVDPRDLLPRPRDVVLLPGRDGLKHGLADARRDLELHHDAPHVRERRAPPAGQFPIVDAGDREREPGLVPGPSRPRNRRLRYGRLVVSGIPHPVRGRDARRGNRCGETLPEGRVRADPHSRARALSDRLIRSRTRRWTKSVPTVNSRLRESWTEDTLGSVWRTWVFAVNSPRLSARQKRYFIGGPWVSWTRTASPMARRNSAKEAVPATTRW